MGLGTQKGILDVGGSMTALQSLTCAAPGARTEVRDHQRLDRSDEAVQSQTFSLALEAAGPILGKSCLDAGCGVGKFSAVLATMGARSITAVDKVLDPRFQESCIRWVRADLENELRFSSLPDFDLVFALDILQDVPFSAGLQTLWHRVRPGGRLVAVVPNGAAPLGAAIDSLASVTIRAFRGLTFQQDQQIVPYRVGPWGPAPAGDPPPDRWLIVAVKST